MGKSLGDLYTEALNLHTEAVNEANESKLDQALNLYHILLNAQPDQDILLFHVATAHHQKGHNGMAIRLFQSLTDTYSDKPELWCNLGTAWKAEHQNDKARECWEKAIALDPRGEYYANLATLHINEGSPEKALVYATQAVELDAGNPKNTWNLALAELECGQYDEGFRHYDVGIVTGDRPNRGYDEANTIPYWMGDDLAGKTIVLYGEQGLGDEIMAASLLTTFIEANPDTEIIVDCHERLLSVFQRSWPDLEIHGTRKSEPTWSKGRKIDVRAGIHSLFRHHWRSLPMPPYLEPDPVLVEKYRARLAQAGPGPYIGIAWEAGTKTTHSHHRSFKLTPLTPVLSAPATFVSLQYTEGAAEKLERYHEDTGIRIHHWSDVVEAWDGEDAQPGFDYIHTLSLLAALDLAVLPNTTAVHACGAIGTPCWSLTPDACAWRYRNAGNHMMMYGDHVTLYRENGDWDATLARLGKDLTKFVGQRRKRA